MTDNLQKQPDTKKAGSRTKTENQVKLIETLRKLGIEKDRAKRLEQLQTYKKSLAERTKEKEKSKQPKDQSESKKEGKSNQSKDQGESKGFPATQDKLLSSPRYSFPASLPVQIEPDALEIIEKWYEKRKGKTDTTKPPSKAKRSKS